MSLAANCCETGVSNASTWQPRPMREVTRDPVAAGGVSCRGGPRDGSRRPVGTRGAARSAARLRAAALVTALGVALPAGVGLSSAHAMPSRGHDVHRVVNVVDNFADVGFMKSRDRYYQYATGAGFRMSSSTRPASGYSTPTSTMPNLPTWFGPRKDGRQHLWAPHVFRIPAQPDGTRFVMYFTGSRAGGNDCIGVAGAGSASGPFLDRGTPIRCASDANLIDPSMYRAPDGKRYLVYKRTSVSDHKTEIRAIRTGTSGTYLAEGATSRRIAFGGARIIEAPEIVNHGGRVWLFVSRGKYTGCRYFTQVWKARSIKETFEPAGGTSSRPGHFDISRRTGANFCGPGGAELIDDGGTWRIAFHAWQHGTASTGGTRTAWTGRVRWSSTSGLPSMVRLP